MTYLPSCENLKRKPLLYVGKAGRNQEPPHLLLPRAWCVREPQALLFLDEENENFLPPFDYVET